MRNATQCSRPCAGCPWLVANQTREAVKVSPVDGAGVHWFEKRNLRRHWKSIAKIGALLPCHATDVNAPLYGGRAVKSDRGAHICVGVTILARREMEGFMTAGTNYKRYREAGGTFSLLALAAWASRLNFAGAQLVLGGRALAMPAVQEDERVQLPWRKS